MNLFIGFIGGFIVAVLLVMADDVKAIKHLAKLRQIVLNKTHSVGSGEIIENEPERVRKDEAREINEKLYGG